MRAEEEDFKTVKLINAPVGDVFNTLSNLDSLSTNLQKSIEGVAAEGNEIYLNHYNGAKSTIKINIQIPHLIQWTVLSDTGYNSEWENTIIRFELEDMGDETCTFHFMHIGLTPELENYQTYVSSWEQFINNIVQQSEHAHVN